MLIKGDGESKRPFERWELRNLRFVCPGLLRVVVPRGHKDDGRYREEASNVSGEKMRQGKGSGVAKKKKFGVGHAQRSKVGPSAGESCDSDEP